MIPIPVGPEPRPQYVRLPPGIAGRIRRTCTLAGAALLGAGGVLALLLGLLASRPPTSSSIFSTVTGLAGVLTGLFVLLLGGAIVGARRYVGVQHLDIAGAAPLRRVVVILVLAVYATAGFTALLAAALSDALSGATIGYLALVLAGPVLATAGAAVTLTTLRPPS